jgi:hypothetical protein
MSTYTHVDLLNALLAATMPVEVRNVLLSIGDNPELSAGESFGAQEYSWEFYGGRESNISSINLGSKPGRSLTERITNAIDGVLEKKMAKAAGMEPSSPMEAAKAWFGRPPSTPDSGLYKSLREFSVNGYDQLVRVVLLPSDESTEPIVDVVDDGIGIAPANFSKTILSLQQGNKIKKRYLAGAFGQGGASTLAFCEYALIVSRHINSPQTVGFTVVKLMRLGEGYKEDAYVYLAVQNENGHKDVPSCEWDGALDLYPTISSSKPLPLETGTLVRHYGYSLDGLEKTLSPGPGNLYHLLHYMMFDPLLPFRVIDRRKEGGYKNELVSGTRNRLMSLTEKKAEADDSASEKELSGTVIRHHAPREMVSPRGDEAPSIGVEYWVIFNYEKAGEKVFLRPTPNKLFVDPYHPIVGTMNGQNQGEMTARILKDINLPMVAKHIVINIDATQASSDVRRNLFSSTREGFKDTDILRELTRVITNMLREDATLYDIEKSLLENMLRKELSETKNEVKQEITNLLRDAGFVSSDPGETLVASEEGDTTIEAPPRRGHKHLIPMEPLPTLPYPHVTRFEIVYPEDILSVHKQDNHSLRIETDADFKFDRENRIAVRVEPPSLEVASKSNLRGGRIHWRLRPTEDAEPGTTGKVIATLTKPDGSQLVESVNFEVLPAREERAKKDKALIPPFNIYPIDPESERDRFEEIWGTLEKDEMVAYKAVSTINGLIIYYSTAFPPYREQLNKLKTQPALASLFTQNYEIWIGYHAIIQHQQRPSVSRRLFEVQDEELEKVQEHERAVVAEMQVKQAIKMAELQNQVFKQRTSS